MNTNVITAAKYTSISYSQSSNYFKFGLLQVYLKGSELFYDTYGYIDMDGKEVIACSYLGVSDFNDDGYCTVAVASTYSTGSGYSKSTYRFAGLGIYSKSGKEIYKPYELKRLGDSYSDTEYVYSNGSSYWYSNDLTIKVPTFTAGKMLV